MYFLVLTRGCAKMEPEGKFSNRDRKFKDRANIRWQTLDAGAKAYRREPC